MATATRTTVNSQRRDIISPLNDAVNRRKGKKPALPPIDEEDGYRTPDNPDFNPDYDPDNDPDNDPDPNPDNNGDDDDDEQDGQDPYAEQGVPPTLADALNRLAASLDKQRDVKVPHSKVREPDQFDGSDARKLRAFLMQLEFTFNDRPTVFQEGRTKVNYALSYLKGTALEWFEPGLALRGGFAEPGWLTSWIVFVNELRTNFGPHDPVGEAESEMERLHLKEGDRITKYNVAFSRLSAQLLWGDAALRHQYYRGLPARIKDEIARVGKPLNLIGLRTLAQSIDARYWERRSEISREHSSSKPSNPSKSSSDQQNKSSSASSSSQKPADRKSDNANSRPANSSRANNSNPTPASRNPELQGKLGKDGKLTAEERQRRFDNKLCMFCGGTGHIAKDCNKRDKAAKARSSNIKPTEPTTVAESSGSKK
jgi:hypothetical protein